ncbi:MAG: YccF domain-containing protein [Nocardioidaceae bacterium]
MRFVLNLLWLVLSGFWMFLAYMVVGVLWCLTVIGIPFGVASFGIGLFALWPFGRTIVAKPGAGVGSGIGNILWFLLSGVWLAIGHAVSGVLLCVTIIADPARAGQLQAHPDIAVPPRQGDRLHRKLVRGLRGGPGLSTDRRLS